MGATAESEEVGIASGTSFPPPTNVKGFLESDQRTCLEVVRSIKKKITPISLPCFFKKWPVQMKETYRGWLRLVRYSGPVGPPSYQSGKPLEGSSRCLGLLQF